MGAFAFGVETVRLTQFSPSVQSLCVCVCFVLSAWTESKIRQRFHRDSDLPFAQSQFELIGGVVVHQHTPVH